MHNNEYFIVKEPLYIYKIWKYPCANINEQI